jgi:glyoxylase-like metal-dependent hydrolase (beta-lactamase superfamily II)
MQISPRCFAVTGLAYIPPWSVNAGFIAGQEMTLVVDTGANALAAATIHGYASAVRPSNGIMVVNTEKHFDHIGGNSYFRDRGMDVYGHSEVERSEAEFREQVAEFRGAIPEVERRGEEHAFYLDTRLENPNKAIRDDAVFDLGGCPVEVFLTPGHTSTNISIYVPGDRVLYCGDCVVNAYAPNLAAAGGRTGWQQWLQSLDRLERLAPKVLVPGHGPVAAGDDVARILAGVRQVLQRAADA